MAEGAVWGEEAMEEEEDAELDEAEGGFLDDELGPGVLRVGGVSVLFLLLFFLGCCCVLRLEETEVLTFMLKSNLLGVITS